MTKFSYYIEKINDGEIDDILPFFGSFENLLTVLIKLDLISQIDIFDESLRDYQNQFLYYLLQENKYREEYIDKLIGETVDVTKEGNQCYFIFDDIEDLANLFVYYGGHRDSSPRELAELILKEDYWDPFWETTDNVYRDVIEELDDNNLNHLKQKIVKELKDNKVYITSDTPELFEKFEIQKDDEYYVNIDGQNISEIIENEESTDYLLDNYLQDIKSDLYSLHSNAYNDAYNSEYHNKIWRELSEYFDSNSIEWIKSTPKSKTRIKLKINDIGYIFDKWVDTYKSDDVLIGERGYLLSILSRLMEDGGLEFLDFRILDYPDSRLVDKSINENFGEYL
jgi:hypothetical protein